MSLTPLPPNGDVPGSLQIYVKVMVMSVMFGMLYNNT